MAKHDNQINEELVGLANRSLRRIEGRAKEKAPVSERGSHGYPGGRLKSEIYVDDATLEEGVIRGRVVSPTPYASFREGVRRGRGAPTPYLRPAGYEEEPVIQREARAVSAQLAKSIFGSLKGTEIKVAMKATGRK